MTRTRQPGPDGRNSRRRNARSSALTQYSEIARLRYDNGYTSYIEVLDAERSLFNAQLQYTQTQQAQFQAMINLYKAMGGGWVTEAEKMSASPAEKSLAAGG
jgi:multidrug efflux system outer membrane protein